MRDASDAREERLLELLLDGEGSAPRDPVAGRALPGELVPGELAATRAWLARAGRGLRSVPELSAVRERALVERVLARTTRAPRGPRAGLARGVRLVRESLASSLGLRLAAAALVLELLAVPVVALLLRAQEPEPVHLVFDVPLAGAEPAFAPPAEDAAPDLRASAEGPAPDQLENALRRARFALTTRPGPPFEPGPDLASRLLAARAAYLARGDWPAWLAEAGELPFQGDLERVLALELLLDRAVLSGERPAAIQGLARALAAARDRGDAVGALARGAVERAMAYGLCDAPRGFDPERVAPPLGPEWFGLLREALGASAPDALARWLEGRGAR